VSMHRKSVLFKHLQLARDPVLRAYGLAGPHVLLDGRNCHDSTAPQKLCYLLILKRDPVYPDLRL